MGRPLPRVGTLFDGRFQGQSPGFGPCGAGFQSKAADVERPQPARLVGLDGTYIHTTPPIPETLHPTANFFDSSMFSVRDTRSSPGSTASKKAWHPTPCVPGLVAPKGQPHASPGQCPRGSRVPNDMSPGRAAQPRQEVVNHGWARPFRTGMGRGWANPGPCPGLRWTAPSALSGPRQGIAGSSPSDRAKFGCPWAATPLESTENVEESKKTPRSRSRSRKPGCPNQTGKPVRG